MKKCYSKVGGGAVLGEYKVELVTTFVSGGRESARVWGIPLPGCSK